jgi:hypothetical protein
MIEELRDCRSILEGLVSPGNEGSCPSRVVERIMTVLEILRQIDSQFKDAAVTLALNKQLTLDQFHLLRAFGALTLSKNIEYEAYCRAVDDGSFAVDHQTQCELAAAWAGFTLREHRCEPTASPNGGPATRCGDSGASERPHR